MQATLNMADTIHLTTGHLMTQHAWERMTSRGASSQLIETVLAYGRIIHARGAEIYALGKREVKKLCRKGIDLSEYEGYQVVCVPNTGVVMTVYRNHDFHALRGGRRKKGHRSTWRRR